MPRSMSAGKRIHPLKLQGPVGEPVSDGDGGYDQEYETYAEPFGSVEAATSVRLERFTVSAAIASATHIITVPFIPHGVAIQDRVIYAGRRMTVLGVADPEERHVELVLVCQEIIP
jgi:head-tail adaptor